MRYGVAALVLLSAGCRPTTRADASSTARPATPTAGAQACESWLTTVESSAFVSSLDVAIGPDGSTLIGGTFLGQLTFDGTTPLSHASPEPVKDGDSVWFQGGGSDGFIAKLDPLGRTAWSRSVGGPKDDTTVVAGLDAAGGLRIAGNFTGRAEFGGASLESRVSGGYGAVFDPDGNGVVAQRPKGWGLTRARGGAVDAAGNLYVLGMSLSRDAHCGFDDPDMPCFGDLFVAKFEPGGSPSWSTRTSGDAQARARGLAVDAAGNVHIAGAFSGSLNLGGKALTGRGESDVVLATYRPDGKLAWARHAATGNAAPVDIASDREGNSYIVGKFWDPTTFGQREPTELQLPGLAGFSGASFSEGLFIAKYDPSGELAWAKLAEDPDTQRGWLDVAAVAADAGGNSYILGSGYRWQDSGDVIEAVDKGQLFLAQFDARGNVGWLERSDQPYEQGGPLGDLAVDGDGNVHVVAFAPEGTSIGGHALRGKGDMFVWRRCRIQ